MKIGLEVSRGSRYFISLKDEVEVFNGTSQESTGIAFGYSA